MNRQEIIRREQSLEDMKNFFCSCPIHYKARLQNINSS